MMNAQKKVYEAYRRAMIMGAVIGGALVIYLVIVEVFKMTGPRVDPAAPLPLEPSRFDALRLIFYALAVAQFGVIGFVRGLILRATRPTPVAVLLEKLVRANVVTLTLCELPALLGLVLFFLDDFVTDFYLLFAVSLLLLFFNFPKYNKWKDWVRDKAGAEWDQDGEIAT